MQKRAFDLLKTWCDTLLEYRVSSFSEHLDGTLLCPTCHVVHGRIADMAFPLALLYVKTGERRYLDNADRFIEWSDFCLSRPDGSWRNDANTSWKGITAFSALAIGEALYSFGDNLPKDIYNKWMKIFVKLSDFINGPFKKMGKVINYYAGSACEQALAYRLTRDEKYLDAAHEYEAFCHTHFDAEGLFYGEFMRIDTVTAKGCRYIDMGYNIEESLPLLVTYSILTGEHTDFYREKLRAHLEFMLPDGAIDNSWGCRHNKWTWWGSRTSDGALEGLALVCDDPMFAEACERVLSLYEKCTHDGLLSLPMAHKAGEPTCLHHSFCHAKALAMLAVADNISATREALPCEKSDGIKFFQNGNLAVVSHKGWRATVSTIDTQYADGCENGGGSMTLLMKGTTPIFASTMRVYNPVEEFNMQHLRNADQTPCMTPRLVFEDGDNLLDKNAELKQLSPLELGAKGDGWEIKYTFGDDVTITATSECAAKLVLPIIESGKVETGADFVTVGDVTVKADGLKCHLDERGFNQVGGFVWIPLTVEVNGKTVVTVSTKG